MDYGYVFITPMRRFLALLLVFFSGSCASPPEKPLNEAPFKQIIRSQIIQPGEDSVEVLRLLAGAEGIYAVTPHSIRVFKDGKWHIRTENERILTATLDSNHRLWYATDHQIRSLDGEKAITLPSPGTAVTCLLWENYSTLLAGTAAGLLRWNGDWTVQAEFRGFRVNNLILDAENTLWAATLDGLWQQKDGLWRNLDETLMAVGHERKYFGLATINEGKDLAFGAVRTVGIIASNGDHQVWKGTDGLPHGPARVIRETSGGIWMGTDRGAILKNNGWHYFLGKRWLPADKVNDILEISPGLVWIATPKGISELKEVELTLGQKAEIYADIIEKRHNRRGLVNISKLAVPGDISTSFTQNEDNDGLWTSCFLGAECFRYAVTQAPDARERAIRTFEALERLELVTGIPGYPARSYALATDSVVQSRSPHPKYWHLSPDGQWRWLDDTSSDEITGHMFTLSLFYELVADEDQKKRVVNLVDRIMTHILDHDFHLIDPDGKPTRWGNWHPDSLNHSPNWLYERGLNSLQILSHLKTAYHFTGKERYEATYRQLVEDHGYAGNAVEAKIYGPFETSHSDDILNFFPYYGLFSYAKDDPYFDYFRRSLERTWKAVEKDRMPVWNVIASALLGRNCGLEAAREQLEQFPLDLIDWTMDNRHRWDLMRDPLVDRFGKEQALVPIRPGESSVSRWNTNPKALLSGRNGMTEETGTYYLFAYWMGKYYGFF